MRWPRLSPRSISDELATVDHLVGLIQNFPDFEHHLPHLLRRLSPHSISSALLCLPFPSALRLFLWSSSHRHLRSFSAHNFLLSCLLSSPSSFPSFWSTLSDLRFAGKFIHPAGFTLLIAAHAAKASPELAVDAFSRMPDFRSRPNTFTYNTLLRLLVDKDVVLLAMGLYNQMIKSDCRPNRATFVILIDGLRKSRDHAGVLKLFDEMLQRGISPNVTVYTVITLSLFEAGKVEEAKRVFGLMREKNCRPDVVACNALLSGLCRRGRVDEAFEQLRLFENENGFVLGVNGYSCLIDGLFRAGRFEDARRYYEEMLRKDLELDSVLYTIMIRGYSEAGRIEEAFSFLSEMTDRGLMPDTYCYNTLIKGLCDIGHLDRARLLRLEISQYDCFPDSATYTIMICGLCKEGLVYDAQQIFEEMAKQGCAPTVMTFNSLIHGLCKAGQLEEARIMFHKMEMGKNPSLFLRLSQGTGRVWDSASLQNFVDELCQTGQVLKAYKLLQDIIDCGVNPDVITYNILINGFCKSGQLDGALRLFKELQLKGQLPDEVTYGTLIDGLLKVHREEDSLMVAKHMLRSGYTPSLSIYNTVMTTLCKKKRVMQAVNIWLDHISHESSLPEVKEAIGLVRAQFEEGRLEEAVKCLIEMDRSRGLCNSSPYTIWVIGYCQAQKVDEALKIFSILMEFDIDVTPTSCVFLINGLGRERRLGSALDVMLYSMKKGYLLMQPVGNRLLKRLCINDKMKDACELARRMSLAGYDMDLYLRETTKALLCN